MNRNLKTALISLIVIALIIYGSKAISDVSQKETVIELKEGEKFVDVEFKNSQLWILTREMNATDTPTTYSLQNFNGSDFYIIIEVPDKRSKVAGTVL